VTEQSQGDIQPSIDGFGDRLADARRERGKARRKDLSKAELGRAVGKGRSNVSAWEKGDYFPPAPIMQELADVLGVNRPWLFFGVGEMGLKPQSAMPQEEETPTLVRHLEKKSRARRTRPAKRASVRRARGGKKDV
jgi:transcriptional regulator with XRE-family HTH domain